MWDGAVPKKLEKQGLEFTDEELSEKLKDFYHQLNPANRTNWIQQSEAMWEGKRKAPQTHEVLKALYSGQWECRDHGPVKNTSSSDVRPRLRDLKEKKKYVIASQRRQCNSCGKSTMHDILVMLSNLKLVRSDNRRKPISKMLNQKIKQTFLRKEAAFGVARTNEELIIDHKFPSQRWFGHESDNTNDMTDEAIRNKFQLLSNQTNMQKSRACDRCVKESLRGVFMGIPWFHEGDERWRTTKHNESGCIGCAWYDLEEWKRKLIAKLRR